MSDKLYTAADLEQARADGLEKLRAFMTGLECENVDQFIGLASKEACSALGKLIKTIVRANERARCIHVAELERISPDETDGLLGDDDTAYNHCVDHISSAIRTLGPIGETREETEKRVRRETVERVKEAFRREQDLSDIGAWTLMGIIKTINVLAEKKS